MFLLSSTVLETDPNYVFVIEVAPQGMEETDELGKTLLSSLIFTSWYF